MDKRIFWCGAMPNSLNEIFVVFILIESLIYKG